MNELTHFSLFTGIGGIDLSAEWAGFKTVGQCEYADYPTNVLKKHWPDVPRWRDIRTVTAESFYERTGIKRPTIISGGFPCQPFSVAGKQRGKDDDRYLWPEMLRVISELGPTWVLGENVAGIVNMALDTVLSDLEAQGYETQTYLIPACGVDAPHRRNRVFIVAYRTGAGLEGDARTKLYGESNGFASSGFLGYSKHNGRNGTEKLRSDETPSDKRRQEESAAPRQPTGTSRPVDVPSIHGSEDGSEHVAHSEIERLEGDARTKLSGERGGSSLRGEDVAYTEQQRPILFEYTARPRQELSKDRGIRESTDNKRRSPASWLPEPNVGRVANGVPSRVDRLKCLGNAVVPQQVYPILKAIADIEGRRTE